MSESPTYPLIRTMKELILSYDEFRIKILPEHVNKPTVEVWQQIYMKITGKVFVRDKADGGDDLIQYMNSNTSLNSIEPAYLPFFKDNANIMCVVHTMNLLLQKCCFEGKPFSIFDLSHPTSNPGKDRLYRILSCVLNFLRFQDNFIQKYKRKSHAQEKALSRNHALEERLTQLNALKEERSMNIEEGQQKIEEKMKDYLESKKNLASLCETFSSSKRDMQKLDHLLTQQKLQLGERDLSVEGLGRKLEDAASKVVPSPCKARQKLIDLKKESTNKKAKTAELVFSLRKQRGEHTNGEQVLEQCSELSSVIKAISNMDIKTLSKKSCSADAKAQEVKDRVDCLEADLQRVLHEEMKEENDRKKMQMKNDLKVLELSKALEKLIGKQDVCREEVVRKDAEFKKLDELAYSRQDYYEKKKKFVKDTILELTEQMRLLNSSFSKQL